MPDEQQFDLLIIGSGEAGKNLAWAMAKAGRHTAVIERKLIGGSCPNIACMPSKNIIHSAKVAELARRGAEFGVMTESISIEMPRVRARKRQMVEGDVRLHLELYKASGAELIMGEAHFVAPKTVEVRSNGEAIRVVAGDQVVLNVGTHAAVPDVPGLKAANPMTHVEALELDRLPEHLVVLGGGFVALELTQAMRRFGSRVTILERGSQLIAREDADVTEAILQLFENDGIEALFNAELLGVEGTSGQGIRARLRNSSGERTLEGSDLLVAVGRVPNTQGIGLEKTGVELDERGYIRVNERLQTSVPDIWAMGEGAGSPQFTHVATDDFRIVRDNLNGGNRTTRDRLIPFCIFTDPELARVGLNESQAQKQGIPYRLAKIPMAKVRRAHTLSETRGFLKALISAETDEILGFTAFGAEAGEIMSVVQTAMLAKLPYTSLRDAILAHPTMTEGLTVLFDAVPAQLGIHVLVVGRNAERGNKTVAEIRGSGFKADFISSDLRDASSAREVARRAVELGNGHVDILVNNAGIFPFGPTHEMTEELFDSVYSLNVKAPYFLVAELAPLMAKRGKGAIVNVSTMVSDYGVSGMSLYGSSKAAINLLTKAWAAEYGPSGVRVNTVTPGPTRTEGTDAMGEALEQLAAQAPAGRPATTDEIAEAIVFLATDRSSFVYGANLAVDGGRTAI